MSGTEGTAVCADCGGAFYFNPAYYVARKLAPPRRCRPCRDEQRAKREQLKGYVVSFSGMNGRLMFVREEGGARQMFACDLLPDALIGSRVSFEACRVADRGRRALGYYPELLPPAEGSRD